MYRAQGERYARHLPLYHYKNRKNTTQRLELKKYNPVLKKMTVHKEIK